MGLKYCDKCQEAVEQIVMVCPNCKSEMFVHRKGGESSIREQEDENAAMNRVKKDQSRVTEQGGSTNPRLTDGISNTGKTIDDLIRAQNRTTHAVRAFVRFLFIQLTGITLAVFLWNLSLAFVDEQACFQNGDNCTGNTFLQFAAAAVWIGSVIWSSRAGWEELYKSNID
jgi:RNA polymerase subunit RPABC4/transcription elongation factor Spt4